MKRFLLVMSFCFLAGSLAPLFAQEGSDEQKSEYYYVNVPIEKVYPYRRGYVVEYRKGSIGSRAYVYLPMEWFHTSAAKGEYIPTGTGTAWPYLAVYYKAGEFSHVRLYVRRDLRHETWGNLPLGTNLDQYFEDVSDIKLEY